MKVLKPFTPSARGTVLIDRKNLWKGSPYKPLTKGLKSCAGRNHSGKITVRHQGGGHKRSYRVIDFKRSAHILAVTERIEYDPNRSAFIALVRCQKTGNRSYIIAPDGLKSGDIISSFAQEESGLGSCMKLVDIPIGSLVHNVEMRPGAGGQIARAGGTCVKVVAKDGNFTLLELPSGERRLILSDCRATMGTVSNLDGKNVKLGKAGRSRWMGVRPSVRGVAMNPVDHPHGGGEGKTSGGRHPVTPSGVATKGKRTRSTNKFSSKYIRSRRK